MKQLQRIVPWLGRLVLLAATVVLALIGLRHLIDPVGAARAFHTSLGSAAGATSMRVGFGAFPLALAAILAVCLVSSRRRLFGLGMLATVMGVATGARLLGIALDGPAAESSRLLIPEITLTALAIFCAVFEWRAGRGVAASDREPNEHDRLQSGSGPGLLRRRVGGVLVVGLALVLVASAIAKLVGVPAVAAHLGALGFSRLVPLVGVLELASAALIAFSFTRRIGLPMASAFFGGAIATHLQHGLSPVAPAAPLALLWLGVWLERSDVAAVEHPVAGRTGPQRSPAAPLVPLPRPAWLPKSVWPFPSQAMEVDGARIAVTDVGRGPVLLFVHTGLWSFVWRDVMLRLAPDFRCICFDAPGTGQSERLPARSISLERASRALTAVVERLDLHDITLVVHDLGGPSGIAGAARVPDRIRGLCAVNAFAWKPSGMPFLGMLALVGSTPMREFSAWTGLLMRVTSSAFGVGRHLDVSSRRAFSAGVGRQGLRAFHGYMRDARVSRGLYEQLDRALAGPFRHLPLLTIFGERNDPLGFQPRWKQLFPDARQIVVADGNHFPMCDDPDLVAASIRDLHRERIAVMAR